MIPSWDSLWDNILFMLCCIFLCKKNDFIQIEDKPECSIKKQKSIPPMIFEYSQIAILNTLVFKWYCFLLKNIAVEIIGTPLKIKCHKNGGVETKSGYWPTVSATIKLIETLWSEFNIFLRRINPRNSKILNVSVWNNGPSIYNPLQPSDILWEGTGASSNHKSTNNYFLKYVYRYIYIFFLCIWLILFVYILVDSIIKNIYSIFLVGNYNISQ